MAERLIHVDCAHLEATVRVRRQQRAHVHAAVEQFSTETHVRERMGVKIDEALQSSRSGLWPERMRKAPETVEHQARLLAGETRQRNGGFPDQGLRTGAVVREGHRNALHIPVVVCLAKAVVGRQRNDGMPDRARSPRRIQRPNNRMRRIVAPTRIILRLQGQHLHRRIIGRLQGGRCLAVPPPVVITNWIWLKVPGGPLAWTASATLGWLFVKRTSGVPDELITSAAPAPLFESVAVTLCTFQLSSCSNAELCEVSVMTMRAIEDAVCG